jgi:hypothetical protein
MRMMATASPWGTGGGAVVEVEVVDEPFDGGSSVVVVVVSRNDDRRSSCARDSCSPVPHSW